jgi:hypothetical protein
MTEDEKNGAKANALAELARLKAILQTDERMLEYMAKIWKTEHMRRQYQSLTGRFKKMARKGSLTFQIPVMPEPKQEHKDKIRETIEDQIKKLDEWLKTV